MTVSPGNDLRKKAPAVCLGLFSVGDIINGWPGGAHMHHPAAALPCYFLYYLWVSPTIKIINTFWFDVQ